MDVLFEHTRLLRQHVLKERQASEKEDKSATASVEKSQIATASEAGAIKLPEDKKTDPIATDDHGVANPGNRKSFLSRITSLRRTPKKQTAQATKAEPRPPVVSSPAAEKGEKTQLSTTGTSAISPGPLTSHPLQQSKVVDDESLASNSDREHDLAQDEHVIDGMGQEADESVVKELMAKWTTVSVGAAEAEKATPPTETEPKATENDQA